MKVLQVIDTLQVAGAEVLLRDLVLGLARMKVECEVYVLRRSGSLLARSLEDGGIPVHAPSASSIYSPLHILRLAAHLRRHHYDLIHVHLFPAQLWVALAARMASVAAPLITTEHCAWNYRRHSWCRPLDRWMYGKYDAIAAVTADTARALIEWLPEVEPRTFVCLNGVDWNRFQAATASAIPGVPRGAFTILSVGRLVHQKDHATTIRALAAVPGAHLVIVGSGSDLRDHRQLAAALNVEGRVHFLGVRNDVAGLLKASDVFVQSSRFEGFGIAALEAMASGLAVVASRVPGLQEVVGNSGLLFHPGDHGALAGHLRTLAGSTDLRRKLGASAAMRARQFAFEQTIRGYLHLYDRVLSGERELRPEIRDPGLPAERCA
ncbi:MAG: glycosyltransferase [Acidobacteria bacterium]|nr:glycosyltransferase [Acidobacteriota bacterium]